MTSTTARAAGGATQLAPVRVALLGYAIHSAALLGDCLLARRRSPFETWDLRLASEFDDNAPAVDIALCDGAAASQTARVTFPDATVLAIVSARSDGHDVIATLHAGAQVCVRGNEPTLIAAYVRSIARRRGLLTEQAG